MDKQKEIEEISQIAITMGQCHVENCEKCRRQANNPYCVIFEQAVILHKCGYGNVKQAVKEFGDSVVNPIIEELIELLFNDSVCKVTNCHKSDQIACGMDVCLEENKQIWKNKVKEKIKQLYGDDKV
ncbi:MAG: hypothetical protein NC131_00990 [Roseburia sp.]|nr:hypothetical protein [Roseburia sp.]